MAIKSVTAANLAEHVAEKRAQGASISTQEQVAELAVKAAQTVTEKPKEGEKSPVVGTTTETVSSAPEPQGSPGEKKPKKEDNAFSARIKELTDEKRELEEFAEGEYTARTQAQRRIQELERQIAALQPKPAEKVEEDPEPKAANYKEGENEKFLSDWGAWNRRQAKRDFEADQAKKAQEAEQQRLIQEANERRANSLKAAREAFTDFDEVIRRADTQVSMQQLPAPPQHIQAVLQDSDYSAHLLYHFATHPDEAKRIFALRPAKAALELGRLETQFAKGEPAKQQEPPAKTAQGASPAAPQTSRAPPPMPSLNAGPGDVPWDATQPQAFADYKRKRIDEIRRKRGH